MGEKLSLPARARETHSMYSTFQSVNCSRISPLVRLPPPSLQSKEFHILIMNQLLLGSLDCAQIMILLVQAFLKQQPESLKFKIPVRWGNIHTSERCDILCVFLPRVWWKAPDEWDSSSLKHAIVLPCKCMFSLSHWQLAHSLNQTPSTCNSHSIHKGYIHQAGKL